MRLGLGTAQIGFDYGVTNTNGKIPESEVLNLFRATQENGIRFLDTAQLYGDSEKRIGKALSDLKLNNYFSIISKIKLDPEDTITSIQASVEKSLFDLKENKLYGLMVHNPDLLIDYPHLWNSLIEIKQKGLVAKIGISVYEVEQTLKLLQKTSPDLIQIPFNFFNQSFSDSGLLKKMKTMNIEVHARSLFLQGILLTDYSKLPPYFKAYEKFLQEYEKQIQASSLSKLQFNLQFGLKNTEIDAFIVGVTSANEFREIIDSSLVPNPTFSYQVIQNIPAGLNNPALWKV